MSTSLVILDDSSSYEGLVKSSVRWMPALRMMDDRVGYCLVMLATSLLVHEAACSPLPSSECSRREGRRAWRGTGEALPLSPCLDLGCPGHVELLGHDLITAILGLELLEALLAPADGDDEDAVLHHPLGERPAYAGCGAGDEDCLVWEGHFD